MNDPKGPTTTPQGTYNTPGEKPGQSTMPGPDEVQKRAPKAR